MEEAFLLQMNDFDRQLENDLRQMLDRVVASRPPTRRGSSKRAPLLAVVAPPEKATGLGGVVAEVIPIPVPVVIEHPAVP